MFLQPLRVPPQAPASEFSHSLKLAQLPFSWKLFQSLFPPSLSATISLFFSIAGFAIKCFRTKWNDQGPAFHGSLPSLHVILPSQCCSDTTSVFQNQTRPESTCRCVHIWASSHMDKSWIQYLWSNWDTLFLQPFSNTGLPTLENTRENFQKEETTTQGSITDYINNLAFSLWFLVAYFYLCFITKPFLLLGYL